MGIWGRKNPVGDLAEDEPQYVSYGPLYDEDGPGDPEFGAWLDKKLGLKAEDRPPSQELRAETKPREAA